MSGYLNENLENIYPHRWVYEDIQYPDRVFLEWTNEQLSGIGIYRIVYEDVPVPEGKRISSFSYEIDGYVAKATPVFEDIPVVVPESVSKAQGKAALLHAGYLQAVEDFIEGLEGADKTLALIAFNDTTEWRRDSPFLSQAATSLGMSEEQLDNLFLLAQSIIL